MSPKEHKLWTSVYFAFYVTSNDAGYEALITSLKLALKIKVENMNAFSDSMFMVY